MLILSRNEGQAIVIRVPGVKPIVVRLLEVNDRFASVRIGIQADKTTTQVHREELLLRDDSPPTRKER